VDNRRSADGGEDHCANRSTGIPNTTRGASNRRADTAAPQPGNGVTTRLFYGWRIVGVSLMGQAFASGPTVYVFGLFVKPVAAEFGASFGTVALGMTLMGVVGAGVAPFLGSALDRHSIRGIMVLGGGLMAVGFGLMSVAPSLWMLGALFGGLVSLGAPALGTHAAPKVVANWFVQRRGRALGISAAGTSAGGLLAPPLTAVAISAFGWRRALVCLGLAVALIAIPMVWFVIVNRPEDLGMVPDGEGGEGTTGQPAGRVPPVLPTWTMAALLRERNFWVIAVALGLCNAAMASVIVNLHPYATDLGIGDHSAALLVSCYSLCGIGGKLIFGGMADRFDTRVGLWIAILLEAFYLGALLSRPGYGGLLLAGIAGGLASGAALPVWGAMLGRCYGRQVFGRVMGLMAPLMAPLIWIVFPFTGWVRDRTGSYDAAFQVFLGAIALAAAALVFLRPPQREPGT
jgi:MFS family permease